MVWRRRRWWLAGAGECQPPVLSATQAMSESGCRTDPRAASEKFATSTAWVGTGVSCAGGGDPKMCVMSRALISALRCSHCKIHQEREHVG